MFSSLCSLRSTQCATLIALATAAGISRTEQPQRMESSHRDRTVVACLIAEAGRPASWTGRIDAYRFALAAPAPWLRSTVSFNIGKISSDGVAPLSADATNPLPQPCDVGPVSTLPQLLPGVSTSLLFSTQTAPSLATADHALPFAVGPPRHGMPSTLFRVDGAFAPGDSTTRRRHVSRIALVLISFFAAPDAPAEPKPYVGRAVFPLNFAPRGEPEFVYRQVQAAAVRAQLGDIFPALFRQNPTSDFS